MISQKETLWQLWWLGHAPCSLIYSITAKLVKHLILFIFSLRVSDFWWILYMISESIRVICRHHVAFTLEMVWRKNSERFGAEDVNYLTRALKSSNPHVHGLSLQLHFTTCALDGRQNSGNNLEKGCGTKAEGHQRGRTRQCLTAMLSTPPA